MPSIQHEAVVELLHRRPELAAVLLASAGPAFQVPPGATATIADSDLSARRPLAFAAENVIIFAGPAGKVAAVAEVQKDPPRRWKQRDWPAYLAIAGREHQCDAVLLVIALSDTAARASSKIIRTGHPGFDLMPIVIGPKNTPSPGGIVLGPELTVLAVLTGALDLSSHEARMFALRSIAHVSTEERDGYTRIIRATATPPVRKALEELMTRVFKDDFMDGLLAQGEAKGEAKGEANMLLRVLAARGLAVTDDLRQRITSCTDTTQLETWFDRAITATALTEVFGD
jgi:hypothetical protein